MPWRCAMEPEASEGDEMRGIQGGHKQSSRGRSEISCPVIKGSSGGWTGKQRWGRPGLLDHSEDFRLYPEGNEQSLTVFKERSSTVRLNDLERSLWLQSGESVGVGWASGGSWSCTHQLTAELKWSLQPAAEARGPGQLAQEVVGAAAGAAV